MNPYFLFLSILLLCACQSKPDFAKGESIAVTAFKVTPKTLPAEFEFVGVAKSSHPVEIRARVEGYLNSIDYKEGSMVQEGQLLFRIDPRQFEASLQEAKGELARQEAILWRAKKSLERIEPLYEQNAASRRDLDNATAAVLAAEASVIEAKANVMKAELDLSYTFIVSPINGLTGRSLFREGTLITPSINGLLTLVSIIDPIWINFSISDEELLQTKSESVGETLILPKKQDYVVSLILADGSQYPYLGHVNFTSPTLDPQTSTMTVRAVCPNPKGEILPGQFVTVNVSGAYRPDALFVPQISVIQGKKEMFVFVIEDGDAVSARPVEVGSWYKDYWIIKKGLTKGEIVVASGVNKIQEGSTVKILSLEE